MIICRSLNARLGPIASFIERRIRRTKLCPVATALCAVFQNAPQARGYRRRGDYPPSLRYGVAGLNRLTRGADRFRGTQAPSRGSSGNDQRNCTVCIHNLKKRSLIRNEPLSLSITSLSSSASTARCAFDGEFKPCRRKNSPANGFTFAVSLARPFRNLR